MSEYCGRTIAAAREKSDRKGKRRRDARRGRTGVEERWLTAVKDDELPVAVVTVVAVRDLAAPFGDGANVAAIDCLDEKDCQPVRIERDKRARRV